MSTRSILVATSLLAIAGLSACQSRYSDVYSFKKNSFVAPVVKRDDIKAPDPIDPTAGQMTPPAGIPGAPSDVPGIPGATPPAPTGIPGLDPAPAPLAPPPPAP